MDRHRPRRAGFTLVEILIVIVIIGILMALLLPAITGAFRRAKEAQVAAEMNNFGTALASFRTAFGDYPPSRIIVCESGLGTQSISTATLATKVPTADNNETDLTYGQLVNRSLLYLRKFWPRAEFVNAPGSSIKGQFNDFNGNGILDTNVVILSGSECLAFFLGGVPIPNFDGSGNYLGNLGMSGFSKSPKFPFVDPKTALNRTVPNYEFVNSRLVDIDGDHFPSYLDPLTTGANDQVAYAYFSAYGTNGYDPNDNNSDNTNGPNIANNSNSAPFVEIDDKPTPADVERGFSVGFPVYDSTSTLVAPSIAVSVGPNPYTSGPEIGSGSANFLNPTSFQLFSAGADRNWGLGGQYVATAGAGGRLPLLAKGNVTGFDPGNTNNEPVALRLREADNITNFSGGRLD